MRWFEFQCPVCKKVERMWTQTDFSLFCANAACMEVHKNGPVPMDLARYGLEEPKLSLSFDV